MIFCQRLVSKCVILISTVHIMAPLDRLFFAPTCAEAIRLHIPTAGATQQHLSCYLTLGEAVEPCTYRPRRPCIYVAVLYFESTGSSLTTRRLRLDSCSFCRLKRHVRLEMQRVRLSLRSFAPSVLMDHGRRRHNRDGVSPVILPKT